MCNYIFFTLWFISAYFEFISTFIYTTLFSDLFSFGWKKADAFALVLDSWNWRIVCEFAALFTCVCLCVCVAATPIFYYTLACVLLILPLALALCFLLKFHKVVNPNTRHTAAIISYHCATYNNNVLWWIFDDLHGAHTNMHRYKYIYISCISAILISVFYT